MLCHRSRPKEGVSIPCAGAILVNGFALIGLPIAAIAGQIEVGEYGGGGAALYASRRHAARQRHRAAAAPPVDSAMSGGRRAERKHWTGVNRRGRRWYATVKIATGRSIAVGWFADEEKAIEARDDYMRTMRLPASLPNRPDAEGPR